MFVYGEKKDYASILDEIELVGLLITPTYIAKSCEFFHLPNYNLHFVLPRRVVRTSVERAWTISNRLGCTYSSIHNWLISAGLRGRNYGLSLCCLVVVGWERASFVA